MRARRSGQTGDASPPALNDYFEGDESADL